jgi:uncharacterized membrane protein HdeD (DUF308 family)
MATMRAGLGADADVSQPERYWYLFAVSGAISLVVGVLVLAYPDPSVRVLGVIIGIDLLAVGTMMIIRGLAGDVGESDAASTLLGTLALIAGIIVVRNPEKSLTFLVVAFGAYLIVTGALALAHAIIRSEHRGIALLRGVVLVGAGTVIVSWPDLSTKTLAILAGIALCLQGAIEIGEGFLLRSQRAT